MQSKLSTFLSWSALSAVIVFSNAAVYAESIDSRYEQAISDTAVMRARMERTLIPLETPVAHMVVWTDYTGYTPNDHYSMPLNLFAAPKSDMQAACHRLLHQAGKRNLKAKINQLLGLPLYDATQQFVEINVVVSQPNNALLANYSDSSLGQALFRPCGDPNVLSDRCGLDFAADTTDEFKLWIYKKAKQVYRESTYDAAQQKFHYGYPWTDLGYTYNWGSHDHFGLQEYVIKKGADVQVVPQNNGTAYISAQDFCR